MKKVSNFLTGNAYSFATSTGGWSLVAPNNGTLVATGEKQKYEGVNSLKLVPANTGPMSVRVSGIEVPNEVTSASYRAGVWIASKDDVIADVTLYTTTSFGNASSTATQKVHGVHINRWTFVSVEQTERSVQTGQYATISFDITFHNDGSPSSLSSEFIYVTSPIISTNDDIYLDYADSETYLRLPEYLRNSDEEQTDPQYPLYRFIDVLNYWTSTIATTWWNYAYFPPFDVEEQKNSTLVDPNLADFNTLIWLARILGITIQDPPTGFTSWAALEDSLDTDASGAAEWDEWEAPGDWASLEGESPDVNNFEEELRWQVVTAIYGINAGTSNALKIAAQRALTGTKQVTVVPRHTGDPWHILVQTLTSETPDASVIPDLLAGAVPAGFQVSHQTV